MDTLSKHLGGLISLQEFHDMATNLSMDLTPPNTTQNLTPEVIDHHYNNTGIIDQKEQLLDAHGFSTPGDLSSALHL